MRYFWFRALFACVVWLGFTLPTFAQSIRDLSLFTPNAGVKTNKLAENAPAKYLLSSQNLHPKGF